jgi:hypothetical protein
MTCYFCQEPLTSDDYKCDRIEKTEHFIAHRTCVDKAIWKDLELDKYLNAIPKV